MLLFISCIQDSSENNSHLINRLIQSFQGSFCLMTNHGTLTVAMCQEMLAESIPFVICPWDVAFWWNFTDDWILNGKQTNKPVRFEIQRAHQLASITAIKINTTVVDQSIPAYTDTQTNERKLFDYRSFVTNAAQPEKISTFDLLCSPWLMYLVY